MFTKQNLKPYQLNGIDFILKKKKIALFWGMSSGKTITTLTAIKELIDTYIIGKVLIVAPKVIAKGEWQRQAKSWEHTKDLKFATVVGTEKQRLNALSTDANIYVINNENLSWLINTTDFNYDCIIIDESHNFKSAKTNRFKVLAKKINKIEYVILLSGTPATNSMADLWSQIFLLDGGKRLFRQYTVFRDIYFDVNKYSQVIKIKPGSETKILNKVKDICFSLDTKDYIELTCIAYTNKYIYLSDKIYKEYRKLEKDFVLTIKDETISATTMATLGNKLLQFCNGFLYDENKNIHSIHTDKILMLKEILGSNPNDNFLVAYNYQADKERILKECENAILFDGSDDQIKAWNEKKIKLLLCHPKNAGYGLNLQQGGYSIIWYGLTWSLQDYIQFNARLHRLGQENIVKVIHLICDKTIDQRIMLALERKENTLNAVIKALKHKYRSIKNA